MGLMKLKKKINNPKIFIGHCFYGEKRVKKYKIALKRIFTETNYDLSFGITGTIKNDEVKEINSLIKCANFCIFDLAGYSPKKYVLNLNIILELGISIGARRKFYILCPKQNKDIYDLQLTNLKYKSPRLYQKGDKSTLLKEIGKIKKDIDDIWKYKKKKVFGSRVKHGMTGNVK